MASRRRRAGVLVLASVLLAACSGGSTDEPSAPTTASEPGSSASTTAVDAGPTEGGVLRVGLPRPASLDPLDLSPAQATDLVLADLLYDGLTRPGPAGVPQPGLATATPNADLTVWTFQLGGAAFSGGRPITATDAKRSLERLAAAGPASLAGVRLESVVGYGELITGAATGLAGLEVVDERTLVVRLTESDADLPSLLASPLYGVVAAETIDAAENGGPLPLTSGSFELTSPTADVLRLARRDGAPGRLEAVEVHLYPDAGAAFEAFDAGELDWAPVPPERAGDAERRYGSAGFVPFHAGLYLAFNLAAGPFQNEAFRTAVARAVDRNAVVEAVYGVSALPLDGVVPRGILGAADAPCAGRCDHDPEAAAATIRQLFPDGQVPTVQLDVDDSSTQQAMAGIVEGDLEAVGVPTEVRSLPFEEYQRLSVSGAQGLVSLGWINLHGSASATLGPLFRSGSADNTSGFVVPEVDFLLGAARAEPDSARRAAMLADVERLVLGRVPIVPLAQFRTLTVTSERVRDLQLTLGGTFDVTAVWLDGGDDGGDGGG